MDRYCVWKSNRVEVLPGSTITDGVEVVKYTYMCDACVFNCVGEGQEDGEETVMLDMDLIQHHRVRAHMPYKPSDLQSGSSLSIQFRASKKRSPARTISSICRGPKDAYLLSMHH